MPQRNGFRRDYVGDDDSLGSSDEIIHRRNGDIEKSIDEYVRLNSSRSAASGERAAFEWRRGSYVGVSTRPAWYTQLAVLLSFAVMLVIGTIADWLRSRKLIHAPVSYERDRQKDFVSLENPFETVFINNLYRKASDVMNRPLAGVPGTVMRLAERVSNDYGWTYKLTGARTAVINMGSYNYLGFSRNQGLCADAAVLAVEANGIGVCTNRHEFGITRPHRELEKCVAQFLGVEDAICYAMGFATNSMNIPCVIGKDGLILSDELVHASLVLGCRLSGATIIVFKHNDPVDAENKLLSSLHRGQPITGVPFRKILIVIEGIYSMEGTIVNLPAFIALKKRYKTYLFIDEAHSIGSLGPTGRGVVEYWGCNPNDVDILMGTLTKSFAASGGYIGGRKKTVEYLRACSHCSCYGTLLSPPVIAQVSTCIKIMTEDGGVVAREKARRLCRNTRYLRRRLKQIGFLVYGHDDSPVVPVMMFMFPKGVFFAREALRRKLALVSVAYPATPLTLCRMRLCVSASHTKEQLDETVEIMGEVGRTADVMYGEVDRTEAAVEY